jgi:cytochrome c
VKLVNTLFYLSIALIVSSLYFILFHGEFAGRFTSNANLNETLIIGKNLYEQRNCISCHGVGGGSPVDDQTPKISAQNAKYLFNQIKDIQLGQRSNGMASIMKNSMGSPLSDLEINAISVYLSQQ